MVQQGRNVRVERRTCASYMRERRSRMGATAAARPSPLAPSDCGRARSTAPGGGRPQGVSGGQRGSEGGRGGQRGSEGVALRAEGLDRPRSTALDQPDCYRTNRNGLMSGALTAIFPSARTASRRAPHGPASAHLRG
eukprot:276219-Prorocentrum_minimum.AAC.3